MVIGNGKSGQDVALAAVWAGAKSVTLGIRTPHWDVPVRLFGVFPCAPTLPCMVLRRSLQDFSLVQIFREPRSLGPEPTSIER